jgi:hypothetical protein
MTPAAVWAAIVPTWQALTKAMSTATPLTVWQSLVTAVTSATPVMKVTYLAAGVLLLSVAVRLVAGLCKRKPPANDPKPAADDPKPAADGPTPAEA